ESQTASFKSLYRKRSGNQEPHLPSSLICRSVSDTALGLKAKWFGARDLQLCLLPLPPRQRGRQKPEFGLHFGGVGDSVCDFLAKEFAIPLAKPVNRNFERSFRRVHFACQRGIGSVGLSEKEHLQPFEMLRAAVMHELVAQFLHDSIEHRKRPALFLKKELPPSLRRARRGRRVPLSRI